MADLFPKFNLTGALGLESLSLKTLASSKSIFWSFGPSLDWKIFSAGQDENIRFAGIVVTRQTLVSFPRN